MRIVLTGGGTGGHVYPALAVARALRATYPSIDLVYIGTSNGLEADLAVRDGLEFKAVSARGILGKPAAEAISGATQAVRGTVEAMGILRKVRPSAVLGTGGYVSGPVVFSAVLMGIPAAIQEQNAIPGFTNKVLGRFVRAAFVAFEETARAFPRGKVIVTGNPVRPEILGVSRDEGLRRMGLEPGLPVVFIFGGSRGARAIVEAGLTLIAAGLHRRAQVVFATGKEYYDRTSLLLKSMKVCADVPSADRGAGMTQAETGNLILRPYIHEIEYVLACADLVVGRAGGMTLAEITAKGIASVLVPSPNVANNHQEHNARELEKKGAALVVREGEGFLERMERAVMGLIGDPVRLGEMKAAAAAVGKPRAAWEIADALVRMARKG